MIRILGKFMCQMIGEHDWQDIKPKVYTVTGHSGRKYSFTPFWHPKSVQPKQCSRCGAVTMGARVYGIGEPGEQL